MKRDFVNSLQRRYAAEGFDFFNVLHVWQHEKLTAEDIKEQVMFDIGRTIDAEEAVCIYKVSKDMPSAYSEDLYSKEDPYKKEKKTMPENLKKDYRPRKMKFTQQIRSQMDRVDHNLFRSKVAGKYWTLKEKIGEDGKKSIFLVAVEEDDDTKKK